MKKSNLYDCLIIDTEFNDGKIFLADDFNIDEVVYNDGSYATLYRLDDNGYMDRAEDVLVEEDFEELFEEYDASVDGKKEIHMHENYHDDEPMPYVKADWRDYEHYLRLASDHGINTSYYDISGAEIIEGICYEADDCICQDYPHTEAQSFYKFVAYDGREFYIRRTNPFFVDDFDDSFELIDQEEFEEYD